MHIEKKFLGAFKKGHRSDVREFIDEELSFELLKKARSGCKASETALMWLSRFNNEYHKDLIKKGDPEALHNSDELVLDCSRRRYATRYDVFCYVKKIGNVA